MLIFRSPSDNIAYEFVLTSPAVPSMSCSWLVRWVVSGRSTVDLFKTERSTFVSYLSSVLSRYFVKVPAVHSYISTATTKALKKSRFIL